MELAAGYHWLEQAIGDERDPAKIAMIMASHPKFLQIVIEASSFAKSNAMGSPKKETRFLAEHIAYLLRHSFPNFETSH